MLCKILAFFILPCLVISFKMDMKPAFEGELADFINAIQTNDQKAIEINGYLMEAKNPNNVTLESSERNQCQDEYPSFCPSWSWACTHNWISFVRNNCRRSCGLCSTSSTALKCDVSPGSRTDCGYPGISKSDCEKKNCCFNNSIPAIWCFFPGPDNGNNECAKIPSWMKSDLANRIVNGKTAPSPIPWQVHLRKGNPTGAFGYFCGGTIIDAKTILTAAHCYHGENLTRADFFVTAGVVHVQDGAGQSAFVEKIILHESYDPSTINNDIAILKLKTPLTFNDNVRQACLPEASFVPTGKAVASGWGLVAQFPDQSPQNLQWVTKPVVTNDKCVQQFNWSGITANMICAGDTDGGEATCFGDSGGPLVIPKSSTDDTAVVIGATSFGLKVCGAKGWPSVYAYVTRYIDWIKPKMES